MRLPSQKSHQLGWWEGRRTPQYLWIRKSLNVFVQSCEDSSSMPELVAIFPQWWEISLPLLNMRKHHRSASRGSQKVWTRFRIMPNAQAKKIRKAKNRVSPRSDVTSISPKEILRRSLWRRDTHLDWVNVVFEVMLSENEHGYLQNRFSSDGMSKQKYC